MRAVVPEGVTYLDFYMQYYTNLVNAAELAGLSLCTMFWAFPQGNEAAQQYLVTIHTGRPGLGDSRVSKGKPSLGWEGLRLANLASRS